MWFLSFFGGLWGNPLARKIIIYVAIAAGAFWAFRVFWLNPHDNRIEAAATIKATKEIEKAKQAEWDAKEKAIADSQNSLVLAQQKLLADRQAVTQRTADLDRMWQESKRTLQQVVTQAKTAQEMNDAQIAALPDTELLNTLRARSAALGKPKP